MTQWLEVDSWIDLLGNLWIGLVLVAVAAVPSFLAHRTGRDVKQVRQQVENQHATNLRDDVDRAIHGIEALATDLRGLRQDLAAEEARRREHIDELRDEVNRKLDGIRSRRRGL